MPNKGKDYTWIPRFEKEKKGKHQPNGRELPKDTYSQSPGEVARRLKQHSKDFKDANSRLTFYRNRQGRNLNPTQKSDMNHAEEALRNAYGTQLSPKEKQEKKQQQQKTQSSVKEQPMKLNASARIKMVRAANWSEDVKTKKHPPEGLFAEGSGEEIANWLHKSHGDLQGAMGSLNFYRNRAGKNLTPERKKALDAAETKIQKMYGNKKD